MAALRRGVLFVAGNAHPWNSADDPCDGDNGDTLNWAKYTGDCVTQLAKRRGAELDGILAELEILRKGQTTAVRVTTDYKDVIGDPHTTPDSTGPSVEVLEAFHSETCRVARRPHPSFPQRPRPHRPAVD